MKNIDFSPDDFNYFVVTFRYWINGILLYYLLYTKKFLKYLEYF